MSKIYLLPIAAALLIAPATFARVQASPLIQHGLEAAVPESVAEPVRGGGGRGGGGGFRGGGGGFRGGAAVVHRGGVYRGGGAVVRRGAVGVGVAAGARRVGGRYYGGTWYGTGRHWYGGRWWPYGVGTCWASTPIGYVWVCG
jgi:hypothetical protein